MLPEEQLTRIGPPAKRVVLPRPLRARQAAAGATILGVIACRVRDRATRAAPPPIRRVWAAPADRRRSDHSGHAEEQRSHRPLFTAKDVEGVGAVVHGGATPTAISRSMDPSPLGARGGIRWLIGTRIPRRRCAQRALRWPVSVKADVRNGSLVAGSTTAFRTSLWGSTLVVKTLAQSNIQRRNGSFPIPFMGKVGLGASALPSAKRSPTSTPRSRKWESCLLGAPVVATRDSLLVRSRPQLPQRPLGYPMDSDPDRVRATSG